MLRVLLQEHALRIHCRRRPCSCETGFVADRCLLVAMRPPAGFVGTGPDEPATASGISSRAAVSAPHMLTSARAPAAVV